MGIGKRIKEARERKGLSRADLANCLEVTVSAISNYENDISSPKEAVLYKLFDTLEVDANYLFQDAIAINTVELSYVSKDAKLIAQAYDAADDGTQAAVRKLLDINITEKEHFPAVTDKLA